MVLVAVVATLVEDDGGVAMRMVMGVAVQVVIAVEEVVVQQGT